MSAIRVVESTGSLGTLQISDGSGGFISRSLVAGTNVTISNSSGSFTINSAGGSGSSVIGAAEDGDYTDGLFTDFDPSNTTVGTAVDRFNEVLKALAPAPAPPADPPLPSPLPSLTLPRHPTARCSQLGPRPAAAWPVGPGRH